MPQLHLYRSQLEEIAVFIGLSDQLRVKKADPDILPELDDRGRLLGSFEEADQILWSLENEIQPEDIESAFTPEKVQYIQTLAKSSNYCRETPYSLL